jgi:hypothetical protein
MGGCQSGSLEKRMSVEDTDLASGQGPVAVFCELPSFIKHAYTTVTTATATKV